MLYNAKGEMGRGKIFSLRTFFLSIETWQGDIIVQRFSNNVQKPHHPRFRNFIDGTLFIYMELQVRR